MQSIQDWGGGEQGRGLRACYSSNSFCGPIQVTLQKDQLFTGRFAQAGDAEAKEAQGA
jgi:hypothetical protein